MINEEQIVIRPIEIDDIDKGYFELLSQLTTAEKPSKELFFNNVHFVINDMESLKVKEYEDADMVMRNNQYDYPSLLAILCRECKGKKTDHVTGITYLINEDYDTEFANHIFDARREMFANMPMTKVMPLISFFLLKGLESNNHFPNSISMIALQLKEAVENMQDSIESKGSRKWLYLPQMIKLKKYKKYINSILQNS